MAALLGAAIPIVSIWVNLVSCCVANCREQTSFPLSPTAASSRKAAIHAQFNQWLQSIRHSDILTTSRYINVNSKKLSEAVERFQHLALHITA
jgi:hypothetical protein